MSTALTNPLPHAAAWTTTALLGRATELARALNPQESSNLIWALAVMELGDAVSSSLVPRLCDRLVELADDLNTDDAGNACFGLAKLGHSPKPAVLDALNSAILRHIDAMHPQQVAYVAWAATKLGMASSVLNGGKRLKKVLRTSAVKALPGMHAQSVGMTLWALGSLGPPHKQKQQESVASPIIERAREVVSKMSWQTIGHAEYFLESWGLDEPGLRQHLTVRTEETLAETACVAAAYSATADAAAGEAAKEAIKRMGPGDAVKKVLLVGCGPERVCHGTDPSRADASVEQLLCEAGYAVSTWRRFSSSAGPGTPWPEPGPYTACICRVPISIEHLKMTVCAISGVLVDSGHLWLVGNVADGQTGVTRALARLFSFESTRTIKDDGGNASEHQGFIVSASRLPSDDAAPSPTLMKWAETTTVSINGNTVPWTVYPGLFAGGALDIMTAFLLRTLPPPPASVTSVLDFAAGSGMVAQTLLSKNPRLNVTLCDADAVAVVAARENCPTANVTLSDCWSSLTEGRTWDWIVSNPPVHSGKVQDFAVISVLIHGAHTRLNAGGTLWMVAQNYVPVGRLLAATRWFDTKLHSNGRFAVWEARLRSTRGLKPQFEDKSPYVPPALESVRLDAGVIKKCDQTSRVAMPLDRDDSIDGQSRGPVRRNTAPALTDPRGFDSATTTMQSQEMPPDGTTKLESNECLALIPSQNVAGVLSIDPERVTSSLKNNRNLLELQKAAAEASASAALAAASAATAQAKAEAAHAELSAAKAAASATHQGVHMNGRSSSFHAPEERFDREARSSHDNRVSAKRLLQDDTAESSVPRTAKERRKLARVAAGITRSPDDEPVSLQHSPSAHKAPPTSGLDSDSLSSASPAKRQRADYDPKSTAKERRAQRRAKQFGESGENSGKEGVDVQNTFAGFDSAFRTDSVASSQNSIGQLLCNGSGATEVTAAPSASGANPVGEKQTVSETVKGEQGVMKAAGCTGVVSEIRNAQVDSEDGIHLTSEEYPLSHLPTPKSGTKRAPSEATDGLPALRSNNVAALDQSTIARSTSKERRKLLRAKRFEVSRTANVTTAPKKLPESAGSEARSSLTDAHESRDKSAICSSELAQPSLESTLVPSSQSHSSISSIGDCNGTTAKERRAKRRALQFACENGEVSALEKLIPPTNTATVAEKTHGKTAKERRRALRAQKFAEGKIKQAAA